VSVERKLRTLGEQAQFDLSCACGMEPPREQGKVGRWLYPAAMPDGSRVRMLKVLLDNACGNDCAYCAQRAGRNTPRDRFHPDELARLFDELVRAGRVQALFLSSGLGGDTIRTMDRMIATVEIIRRRYQYRGFIHLKILPGVQYAQVERAAQLAQRISINLEVPGSDRLALLSRKKNFQDDILLRMWWISRLVAERKTLAKGHTTQFVVGASGESDREIVRSVQDLYGRYQLSRAYYSGFQPVPDTPLENRPPTAFLREHRLYQVDFLLRKYGFNGAEIPFGSDGNLSLQEDPKTCWARAHPEFFPLEINRADPQQLLRVPGLGPLSVKRIVAARKTGTIRFLSQLSRLGGVANRAGSYLLFKGKPGQRQLSLW
jgi:predicted DNA-binding helix-hairpin-helix protein